MDEDQIKQRRQQWQHRGHQRPDFALTPGPGQESVWDYPRPPAIEENYRTVRVYDGETLLAESHAGFRVLETAGAPTYYLPADDVDQTLLTAMPGHSFCEWKGQADYWALAARQEKQAVAWTYPEPFAVFAPIADCFAFYPSLVQCYVDDAKVSAQPGGFYGGWVTPDIVGPFKGEAGTSDW